MMVYIGIREDDILLAIDEVDPSSIIGLKGLKSILKSCKRGETTTDSLPVLSCTWQCVKQSEGRSNT